MADLVAAVGAVAITSLVALVAVTVTTGKVTAVVVIKTGTVEVAKLAAAGTGNAFGIEVIACVTSAGGEVAIVIIAVVGIVAVSARESVVGIFLFILGTADRVALLEETDTITCESALTETEAVTVSFIIEFPKSDEVTTNDPLALAGNDPLANMTESVVVAIVLSVMEPLTSGLGDFLLTFCTDTISTAKTDLDDP